MFDYTNDLFKIMYFPLVGQKIGKVDIYEEGLRSWPSIKLVKMPTVEMDEVKKFSFPSEKSSLLQVAIKVLYWQLMVEQDKIIQYNHLINEDKMYLFQSFEEDRIILTLKGKPKFLQNQSEFVRQNLHMWELLD